MCGCSFLLCWSPLTWHLCRIVQYLLKERAARGIVCLSWLVCLCTALPFIHLTSQRLQFRRHISRKMFHFLAAVMFFLVIEQQRPLMSLALGVALCGLLVAEYIRVLQVPVLGPMIQAYYTDFVDSRDNRYKHLAALFCRDFQHCSNAHSSPSTCLCSRKLILTHIYLLVGCASTVWLSEALRLSGVDDVPSVLPHLGWLTIGVGDAMVRLSQQFNHAWCLSLRFAYQCTFLRPGGDCRSEVRQASVAGLPAHDRRIARLPGFDGVVGRRAQQPVPLQRCA